jgi:hypothetical protein
MRISTGVFVTQQQPDPRRIYESIAVPFGWLVFLALWLFYYASSFNILQNLAVILLSFIVAGVIEILVWVPWAMKQADQG